MFVISVNLIFQSQKYFARGDFLRVFKGQPFEPDLANTSEGKWMEPLACYDPFSVVAFFLRPLFPLN